MLFLAIETSCDETSLALGQVVESQNLGSFWSKINSIEITAALTSSQVSQHEIFGGVVPELGARLHAENIHWLLEKLLNLAASRLGLTVQDLLLRIDMIFVTAEVGLVSALRVGVELAKSLSYFLEKQTGRKVGWQPVNHLEGHLFSCFYQQVIITDETTGMVYSTRQSLPSFTNEDLFPHLHLLVSGGNTQILWLTSPNQWTIVGRTIDDAAGECFDKIGRMVGLPYPGGVWLSRIAGEEDTNLLNFPLAMKHAESFDVSYSGLKTAVRYFLQKATVPGFKIEQPLTKTELEIVLNSALDQILEPKLQLVKQVCVSAQTVIIEQLVRQFKRAMAHYQPKSIGLSGGVSANPLLRKKIQNLNVKPVLIAHPKLTGDNAIMIGLAGYRLVNLNCNN